MPLFSRGPRPDPGSQRLDSVAARRVKQQPTAGSAQHVLWLQRTAGNRAVARAMADPGPELTTVRTPFTVDISRSPRSPTSEGAIRSEISSPDFDAEEGVDQTDGVDVVQVDAAFLSQVTAEVPSALAASAPTQSDAASAESPSASTAPGGAGSVSVPDMIMPEELTVADHDSVKGAIRYSPSIAQAGTVEPFGATTWNRFNVKDITVASSRGAFTANFTLENPITFNVASPKTSIDSIDDSALTNANFRKAAKDLTPDMSLQGGKPPRRKFWARDLTVRHERFHSEERQRFHADASAQAQQWLSAQTAAGVDDVRELISKVPGRVIAASRAAAGTVDEKETRAYGNGAASYTARAEGIAAKGAKGAAGGGYP